MVWVNEHESVDMMLWVVLYLHFEDFDKVYTCIELKTIEGTVNIWHKDPILTRLLMDHLVDAKTPIFDYLLDNVPDINERVEQVLK